MLQIRFVIAGLLFLTCIGLRLWIINIFSTMIDEVNRRLTPGEQVPLIGSFANRGVVIRHHRAMFPNSNDRKKLYAVWATLIAASLVMLACVVQFK